MEKLESHPLLWAMWQLLQNTLHITVMVVDKCGSTVYTVGRFSSLMSRKYNDPGPRCLLFIFFFDTNN